METRPIRPVPRLFQVAVAPLQAFFQLEASSGILLALCAVAAMVWANSPWADSYVALFDAPLALGLGGSLFHFTVRELINDGLMTIFFFLVGMEIKRELAAGELRTLSRALLPLIAAVGGMVVPALLYAALNAGTPALKGWAIPMATDIAFAIGCLTLLKGRVSHGLVVFLTALAIFDDIGGILVIALFYGTGVHVEWLLGALALTGLLGLCNRYDVRNGLVYAVLGGALWYAMHHGGVHATIAGVVVGMMIPARPTRRGRDVLEELHAFIGQLLREPEDESVRTSQLLHIEEQLEDIEPPLTRFEHLWHGWVAYGIVPLFALANSGISVKGMHLADLIKPLPLGVMLGLFVGKQVGIFLFTWVAVKLRLAEMPGQATALQLHGVAVVGGIGFTVALFVAGLAFSGEPSLLAEAKLGILLGSLLSAVVGYLLLRFGPTPRSQTEPTSNAPSPKAA
ncbi:Na+/H+ antiporter NhaA [Vitiosangium sp. GDMCC 1.1324]|uniref:Na+/H+ antiporter NhaA n=1 Tax=Vitiosangium sp. (strain GDMCC 1.1324) TaxID=2138576 RepID=UPI000D390966|nr:Na+/H+ antiporter NhaA [Vitiosangium sp. GDMCC 1.1324]PTL85704.1 Na+/H+ antiporter NhaA [Vitiosangium sp. GDMCC 1.1324]